MLTGPDIDRTRDQSGLTGLQVLVRGRRAILIDWWDANGYASGPPIMLRVEYLDGHARSDVENDEQVEWAPRDVALDGEVPLLKGAGFR